jgi:hypothetical protein
MKKILFVHGFGVLKDARGMFTDIVTNLSDTDFVPVLFDLNDLDEEGNLVVNDFSKQARRLKEVWAKESQDAAVYIVAHSQGCVITALANLPNITKTIFLAPPTESKGDAIIDYFKSKLGTEINLSGVSKLARSDGSFTVVPASYWIEKNEVNVEALYRRYIQDHPSDVVRATQDEVISNEGMAATFVGIAIRDIATNHNFEDEGRIELVSLVQQLLEELGGP